MMPDTPTTPRLLLRPAEAAEALAISERTLWSLSKVGEIPTVRIGRSVRYSAEDLRAWIAGQKTSNNLIMEIKHDTR